MTCSLASYMVVSACLALAGLMAVLGLSQLADLWSDRYDKRMALSIAFGCIYGAIAVASVFLFLTMRPHVT